MNFPVKQGICSSCKFIGYTQLHHDKYDDTDPLKYTRELCASCHGLETAKENRKEYQILS